MWVHVLFFLLPSVHCANILFANDLPSPSHQIWNYALVSGLIQKGHNITMIGPDAAKSPKTDKYHPIAFEGIYESFAEATGDSNTVDMLAKTPLEMMQMFMDFTMFCCNFTLNTNGMKQLLNYPKDFKFDLIILDVTQSPCLYPLIQKFNYPPTIGVTAFLLPTYLSFDFGNSLQPSYLPWTHLPYSEDMSFLQRTVNFVLTYLDLFLQRVYVFPKIATYHAEIFGDQVDSIENLKQHISLLLSNVDPILYYPQPITPNIIPVGGLHTRPPKKLPEDLQNFMDKSKRGVIIFSLGTNIKSSDLGADRIGIILDTFKKLPYDVLWKFESEMENIPKNIKISPWLPLNDLLAHKNTKLFISHGGALSTQEAMFHGVPVLGMPFFADQHLNIQTMVKRNLAEHLDFHTLTSNGFLEKIMYTVENQKIAKNMKEISTRFRTLPETPLNRAVLWVEYVLKHKGAKFLSPKSRRLPFFVASSLDVIVFLSLMGVGVSVMFWLLITRICRSKSKLKKE